MGNEKQKFFEPFCLDLANEQLWDGLQAIKLRPKAFAVLDYLLQRPGQLVTKEELLNAVWPGTFVGEAVLKVVIRQIREALGDDPKSPRFIETAHRRGYRFIGPIADGGTVVVRDVKDQEIREVVVGRDDALLRMRGWLDKALGGERQIIFVTGEPGIGKTSLVDTFARSISNRNIRIGRGQCLEQYGTSEAYLPVLEAIGRLCREHEQVIDVLRAHAPMWLMQLPSLLSAADRGLLNREMAGATRERMLREMGDALEVLAADQPLVLILEDLHWSDYSTLDLISYIARQRQAAQLMMIGTYRPVELMISGHPLKTVKRELQAKQQCEELPLEYLTKESVTKYLSIRFPSHRFPEELASLIHERTDGSPLFMVNAGDYLIAEKLIRERDGSWELVEEIKNVEVGVPEGIKQLIEKQLDHLNAEQQRTLEAASVAGTEFSPTAVAAGLGEDRAAFETRCDELARHRQFIQDCGVQELPNGEAVTRYGFIHALYQNVLYERVSPSRRVQLHRRLGNYGEDVYGERAGEIAAELAMHFERGWDYWRAAKYLQKAADNDIRRFAYREAVRLSRRGLELIKRLPDTPERARQELHLQITLGMPLVATEGYAAPDVGAAYTRARELCWQLGEDSEIFQVLWGLWTFYVVKSELKTAREIAEEFLRLAEHVPYAGLSVEITLLHMGEFTLAMEHFRRAFALFDPKRDRDDAFRYAQNSGVATQCHASWALWFLGMPDEALARIESALALARELSEPHGLAHTLLFSAIIHQLRREERIAQEHAEASIAIASEHELLLYQATSTVVRGWALIEHRPDEAVEQIRQGLASYEGTGTQLLRPHFLALLAEALSKTQQAEAGLLVLEEALSAAYRTGERYYQAELYRLKGELLLQQSTRRAKVEECFDQSIKIAKRQDAKSLELRAAMSVARFYRSHGRRDEARRRLAQIYGTFTDGFATADLREAKALLVELS